MNDFKDKVVYQIYPKSFMDSNGDGFGDLKGVTAKLDYLADLGVDYLWLTPFFPSPQRDNGYDVADYRAVDPRYGTMEDLEELIREADRRGIGLMLDMVFNHTSTEHEWFKKHWRATKRYQDYYIFKDGTPDRYPTNWVSKFGGPAWEYVPCLGKWYLHLYDVMQADLNWENPAVRRKWPTSCDSGRRRASRVSVSMSSTSFPSPNFTRMTTRATAAASTPMAETSTST